MPADPTAASPPAAGPVTTGAAPASGSATLTAPPPGALRLALAAGTIAVALSSNGDVFALAALLGLLAADVAAWATATLVAVSVLMRWGTTSLAAIAGAQAVLGPAGWVGSVRMAGASWLAAAAVAVGSPPGLAVLPFGLAAGLLVAGPSVAGGIDDAAWRVAGAAGGAVVAFAASRWVPVRLARWAGMALAVAAIALLAPGTAR